MLKVMEKGVFLIEKKKKKNVFWIEMYIYFNNIFESTANAARL